MAVVPGKKSLCYNYNIVKCEKAKTEGESQVEHKLERKSKAELSSSEHCYKNVSFYDDHYCYCVSYDNGDPAVLQKPYFIRKDQGRIDGESGQYQYADT